LAYDACRKTSLGLLMAQAAAEGQAAHVTTFDAAAAIDDNFGGRQIVTDAAHLRNVRHGAEDRAETVSAADFEDALAIGDELIEALQPAIEQILQGPS
jgi:hypothetical protein